MSYIITTSGTTQTNDNGLTFYTPTTQTDYNSVIYTSNCIYINNADQTLRFFDLPRQNEIPISVFASGRMLAVGIICSDCEVSFANDKIIFHGNCLGCISYNEKIFLSIEYKDEIHHYKVNNHMNKDIDASLLSVIKK
jgi:hypothetical protein